MESRINKIQLWKINFCSSFLITENSRVLQALIELSMSDVKVMFNKWEKAYKRSVYKVSLLNISAQNQISYQIKKNKNHLITTELTNVPCEKKISLICESQSEVFNSKWLRAHCFVFKQTIVSWACSSEVLGRKTGVKTCWKMEKIGKLKILFWKKPQRKNFLNWFYGCWQCQSNECPRQCTLDESISG